MERPTDCVTSLCLVLLSCRSQLYALWPEGTCDRLGLSGRTNITLQEMVSAMVNVSNPPGTAKVLNQQLKGLLGPGATASSSSSTSGASSSSSSSNMLTMVTALALNCTDMPTAFIANAAEISQQLYCGYYQSRCGSSNSGPQQLTAAFDWKGVNNAR